MDWLLPFKERSAVIGIVGLGYVGLPLILEFNRQNYKVVGFDVDLQKVQKLNNGQSYIEHIESEAIAQAIARGFRATTDFSEISLVDAIIIAVPTPLDKYREPDLSFVINTIKSLAPYLKKYQVLSLESTTYPGTTEEVLKPIIEKQGFIIGDDFYLVYSPEREDPVRKDFTCKTIPKICSGVTKKCLEAGLALYGGIVDRVVPVSSTRTAELTKILENTYRAVNIGLVNEMKIVADKMDIDIYEVIDAAATKPFGFTAYYPGPGIGGHCIPIDPFYLTWKAREYGIHTRFIELAGEINSSMPDYVMMKVIAALNNHSKSLKGSKILVLGIAYKRNIDDVRESPSIFLMEKLQQRGALIDYSDPHVPIFPKMRDHHFDLSSVLLTPEVIASYDCVVLATDHAKFDYKMVFDNSKLLVDTRGVYREKSKKLVKA